MGDLNQFKRSKARIVEILTYLMHKTIKDEQTDLFIADLQESIKTLDLKMEEFYFNTSAHKSSPPSRAAANN